MTNGEKLDLLFPDGIAPFSNNWLNAEYKAPIHKESLVVEDCISRTEVLKLMKDNWHTHNGDWAMQESLDDIRALPSVEPKAKTGHWIEIDIGSYYRNPCFKCSECGYVDPDAIEINEISKYCPNCGCAMRGEEDGA